MKLTPFGWTLTTLAVIACGGGGAVVAQQMAERAAAQVNRNQPGQAAGGRDVLPRLQLPPASGRRCSRRAWKRRA